MKLRKILAATDFTPCSAPAIDAAVDLARDEGASVTLFHVCEPPPYSTPDLGMYTPSPELSADIVAAARRQLEERQVRCAGAGVPIDTAWTFGAPASEIVRYAAENDYDLIVVGSHGRRGFRRLVLGSVAEAVVRGADRPVLTVQGGENAPATIGAA
jgi:nucleotide-binding universal stress UspA family protein